MCRTGILWPGFPIRWTVNGSSGQPVRLPSVFFALTLMVTHWMMKPLPSPKRVSMRWSVKIGNTDSEPVYSLQGTISSGAVVLTTNGENLRVVGPLAAGVSAGNRHRHGHSQSDGQRGQYPAKRPVLFGGAEFPGYCAGAVNEVDIAVEGSAVFNRTSHTGKEPMEVSDGSKNLL